MRPLERFPGPCRDAATEDIRQRLRELPQDLQPPYDWAEFRRRALERPRSAVKWEHAAAAAGITVLIATMAIWGRADHHAAGIEPSGVAAGPLAQPSTAIVRQAHSPCETPESNGPDRSSATDPAKAGDRTHHRTPTQVADVGRAAQAAVASQIAALGRAAISRRWLEQQPSEPAVVRVGSRLAVANLEDRIAWVDDALTDAQLGAMDAAGLKALRQQRASLVSSLAQVRYAETLAAQAN